MPIKILIVGGAGYIGSHMTAYLARQGFIPIVLDNLSTGHADAVTAAELIVGDMNDEHLLEEIFSAHAIDAVMNFASFIEVAESVTNPLKYYQNNVADTLVLLRAMLKAKVKRFIFSSSAAIYGEPQYTPIDERHPLVPINPYGRAKLFIEQILQDLDKAHDLKFMSLRYFNAAGSDGVLAEKHEPETHLIPLMIQAAKQKTPITLYGRDYPTPDGTCIRDYVHVSDICAAHELAVHALLQGAKSASYNLGTGKGFSVQEIIQAAERLLNCKISIKEAARRSGDPAILVADSSLVMKELGWKPRCSDINSILKSLIN